MKALSDETLGEIETAAREGAKHIRAFLTYQGTNVMYEKKAKVSAVTISSYSRLRATETNRAALILAACRMVEPGPHALLPMEMLRAAGVLPESLNLKAKA